MKAFLRSLAENLLQQPAPLYQLAVVMPSRRAAVFLERELAQLAEKPIIAPAIYTVEDLVQKATKLQYEEPAALIFKAYEAYREAEAGDENFDQFSRWAQLLVNDFNEIDRHLVPAAALFDFLADVKRIEHWDLSGEPNQLLEDYLALWQKLPAVYHQLRQKLLAENRAYQGLAYRQFAEQLPTLFPALTDQHQYFFFAGFNALNQAEEKIFDYFLQSGKAQFIWDVDQYYLKDPEHEAGQFLRQSPLVKKLRAQNQFHGLHQKLSSGKRQVESIAVPGHHLQAYLINDILGQIPPEAQKDTALVMADEQLLPAFLNCLHPQIGAVNVTMGYPLQSSPLSGFFDTLLRFKVEAERARVVDKSGAVMFYHQLWDALLQSPFLRASDEETQSQLEQARKHLIRRNAAYRSYPQLFEDQKLGFLEASFFQAGSAAQCFEQLAAICEGLKESIGEQRGFTSALYGFYQAFKQLAELHQRFPCVQSLDTALRFYREILPQLSLDLRGEPLSGLQIMGMLETRCLDFKTVIISSLNEGILPKGRSESSLIPFDVKRKYGLPTYLDKDAVYAYHFYRLLQNAERIVLVYNTADKNLGGGEASRFIQQLELEWPAANKELSFQAYAAHSGGQPSSPAAISIPKSPSIMARLAEMAENGFSATALSQYLRDPLEFYFERVAGLKPNDDLVVEEAEARVQGTIIHRILEEAYSLADPQKPGERIARTPTADDPIYQWSFAAIKKRVAQELQSEMGEVAVNSGPNLLTVENMSRLLHNFLAQEKEQRAKEKKLEVLAVEQALEGRFKLASGLEIKLRGTADRLERIDGLLRVSDYKTGGKGKSAYCFGSRTKEEGLAALVKRPAAIQLLFYAYLCRQQFKEERVSACILSLRQLKENPMKMYYQGQDELNAENADQLEADLEALFAELFDPDIPFQARTETYEHEETE